MDSKDNKRQPARAPKSPNSKSVAARQLIASGVAIGILGLGAWSLLGRNAPYHPDVSPDDVTRGGPSGLSTILGND